jgi:hypothetical protein
LIQPGDTIHGEDESTTIVGTDMGDGVYVAGGYETTPNLFIPGPESPEVSELTKPKHPEEDNNELPALPEPDVPEPEPEQEPEHETVITFGAGYGITAPFTGGGSGSALKKIGSFVSRNSDALVHQRKNYLLHSTNGSCRQPFTFSKNGLKSVF